MSRCWCESMTAPSIFSKALWWLHILSPSASNPDYFGGKDFPGTGGKNSCSRAPRGKCGSYFNFHFVTEYRAEEYSQQTLSCLRRWIKIHIPICHVSVEMYTKTGLITDASGAKHARRQLAGGGSSGGGRQAAITNQMIAAYGVDYMAAANMILQANYLWPHKGNCQCAVLYLSFLAQMFSCHRQRSHEGRKEEAGVKSILSQDWMFGMGNTAEWTLLSSVFSQHLLYYISEGNILFYIAYFFIMPVVTSLLLLVILQMSYKTDDHLIKVQILNMTSNSSLFLLPTQSADQLRAHTVSVKPTWFCHDRCESIVSAAFKLRKCFFLYFYFTFLLCTTSNKFNNAPSFLSH